MKEKEEVEEEHRRERGMEVSPTACMNDKARVRVFVCFVRALERALALFGLCSREWLSAVCPICSESDAQLDP